MARKKSKKEIYENLLGEYRPTIRSFVLEILRVKLFNLQNAKQPVIPTGAKWVPEEDRLKDLPLKYMAVVNRGGLVVELIRINEETASELVKKQTRLIPFDPKSQSVKKGMWYNNKKFYAKDPDEKEG
jgi:hypothetical protein